MAYIIENDLRRLKQRDVNILLNKIEDDDPEYVLNISVLFAIEVVKSKIQHRYDPAQIFIDIITEFSLLTTYAVGALIYYTEATYSDTTAYNVGDRVSFQGYIYTCIQAGTGNSPTNSAFWTQVVADKRYYTVTAESTGNYPDDSAFFEKSDSRNQLILTHTLYIAIYDMFKKAQPTQVPEWSVQSYDEAIKQLNRIGRGLDTVLLPVYDDDNDDQTGQEITYNFPYENQNYEF